MVDPYPNVASPIRKRKRGKKKSLRTEKIIIIENDLYDSSTFNPDIPPRMIYVPNKTVMRKLMKICISVTDSTEIYYYM